MIADAKKRATFSFLINGRKQMITSYLAINSGFIVLLGKSAKYGTSEDICGHLRFYLRPRRHLSNYPAAYFTPGQCAVLDMPNPHGYTLGERMLRAKGARRALLIDLEKVYRPPNRWAA